MEKTGVCENGERKGIWKIWHKSGRLKEMGAYEEDYKKGVWKEWDENGKLIKEQYKNDKEKMKKEMKKRLKELRKEPLVKPRKNVFY